MDTLRSVFEDVFRGAFERSGIGKIETTITEHNVYQEGSEELLPFLDRIVQSLILPGSGVEGMENLEELLDQALAGKSCLLLVEHYSNLDLSLFSWLVRQAGGRGDQIDRALVAIAGMKLNEENPLIATMASAYTRLVICPSRSVESLDPERDRQEILRGNAINRAAMKSLLEIKNRGKIVLVFPSGTRYRPWDPSTKKGVREIDSYIRSFDYMCCVALNGEILHVHRGDMLEDAVSRDLVRISAGKIRSCTEFRDQVRARAEAEGIEDKKQAVVDAIMAELELMHIAGEERRQKLLAARG
jgi:glycerol-3-phosphate O-acyltransferase